MKKRLTSLISCLVLVAAVLAWPTPPAAAHPKGLTFPVLGGGQFSNDFYAYRALNGVHRATDIFAAKHTPIVAATDGVVEWAPHPEPTWGWGVSVRDAEGFSYWYLHLNNDTPGSDDGRGGARFAYGPDIVEGAKVKRGQLIGYLGDSGNAETTPPHLHFEIIAPDGAERINPYPYLMEATVLTALNPDYPPRPGELLPYGPRVQAQVSVATGRFRGGQAGLVTGTGAGYAPHVRVLDPVGNRTLSGFYAYNPAQFTAGVDVAAGDIDGDGVDEIITGTVRGAPHVRVLRQDGQEVGSFYAYDRHFAGGVHVAAADTDGDGRAEVITGPGPGGPPLIKRFAANGRELGHFYAYGQQLLSGVDVAGGDVLGDGRAEVVTVPGPGGSAHLRVFTGQGVPLGNGFNAYEAYTGYTGGARVSVGNVRRVGNGVGIDKAEILVGPRLDGGPHLRLLRADGSVVREGYYYEPWWSGNYDVAAGDSVSYVATGGNRRASIRQGPR